MMATTAVVGLSTAGKRLFTSSLYYSDVSERLLPCGTADFGFVYHHHVTWTKNFITTPRKPSCYTHTFLSNRNTHPIRALKEDVNTASDSSCVVGQWVQRSNHLDHDSSADEFSIEALLLLQKCLLEKQWNLSTDQQSIITPMPPEKSSNNMHITCSGVSARQRRIDALRKVPNRRHSTMQLNTRKRSSSVISPELLQNRVKGYVKGITNEELLTHSEVLLLSKKIKNGLHLEEQKSRLKQRLGWEPTEEQLATSLRISRAELQFKQIECSLAREKLAMSNVRLVISIAQRYENMGAEMADLVQGGLIGLLRGIEKFDSSKGFKISTYVYWWIRQGVSRALVENSRTLRLPTHLHERLCSIRSAKSKLEGKGITPSIDRIAECLKLSRKKVRNATEAISKVFSLDREAFPSLNGLPGETLHSYIADNRLENNPWHGVDEGALKEEVNILINTSLRQRERDIIRLYYGLDKECLTWEEISRRIGLSRERVRQVGLVALEKLKHAARKKRLEAMLVKQ